MICISDRPVFCNIHDGIGSTILILKHRLKASETHPEIQVIKHYGQLPLVKCFAGQLNQVFMNILANAIDALEESNIGRRFAEIQTNPNCIRIITQISDDKQKIIINIKDIAVPDLVRYIFKATKLVKKDLERFGCTSVA